MAKKPDLPRVSGEMNFIMFSLRGGDDTLQQSFRTIGQALENAFQRAKGIPTKNVSSQGTLAEPEIAAELIESEQTNGEEEVSVAPRSRSNRPPPRTPELLDLDLTKGNPPLTEFIAQKNPGKAHEKRYLVIAYWMKYNLNINEITTDHINTGYKHMGLGWNLPTDPGMPLRKLKAKQWLNKGGSEGAYSINHIGEKQVNEMGTPT